MSKASTSSSLFVSHDTDTFPPPLLVFALSVVIWFGVVVRRDFISVKETVTDIGKHQSVSDVPVDIARSGLPTSTPSPWRPWRTCERTGGGMTGFLRRETSRRPLKCVRTVTAPTHVFSFNDTHEVIVLSNHLFLKIGKVTLKKKIVPLFDNPEYHFDR